MALDLNISPYYEDYDEGKNYHKILFKPGVPVQARELTQSQSILQNQVKRIGDYLFKDGDKVTGSKPSVNLNARTIRIKDFNSLGNSINPSDFLNHFVVHPELDIIGFVEFVFAKDDPDIGDSISFVISLKKYSEEDEGLFPEDQELYFYLDYTDALNKTTPDRKALTEVNVIKNAFCTSSEYSKTITLSSPNQNIQVGDYLAAPQITKRLYVTKVVNAVTLEISDSPGVSLAGDLVQFTRLSTCPTSILTQDQSVFYKNGYLVRSPLQRIVPDKNTSLPSKMIGLFTEESIITSNDDETLLDPALESSNYFAEGADRLKIELLISSIALDGLDKADTEEDFIPILKFNKGQIEFVKESTTDSVLDTKLATRTYDESGNYIVNDFFLLPETTTDTDPELRFNISSGKAYIGGYEVNTVGPTEITVPKTTTTETITNYNVNTTQGTYWKIKDIQGELIRPQTILAKDAFLELHNVTNPTDSNSKVGLIIFKNLEYDSYITDYPTYKIFVHYYAPVQEVPASWSSWSTKYGIPSDEGQYIANVLYTNNDLLGRFGAAKTPYYGLFREPDTAGVATWWREWVAAGRVIDNIKQDFITGALQDTAQDALRVTTNSKSYLQVINSSPFLDGLTDVYKIKSIVGVANEYTSHGTSATYLSPFFYANIAPGSLDATGTIIGFDQRNVERLVFPFKKDFVNTVQNIATEYTKVFNDISFTGGVFSKTLSLPETYPLGDGEIPASVARSRIILLIKTGATAGVPYGTWSFEEGTVTISGNQATLTIDVGDSSFSGTADISLVIESDNLPTRTKTLVQNEILQLNINTADKTFSMGKSDIFKFGNMYRVSNVGRYLGGWNNSQIYTYGDIVTHEGAAYTSLAFGSNIAVFQSNAWELLPQEDKTLYILDDGQRDTVYDLGSVKYIGPTSYIPGNVLINFDYFTQTGEGPITSDSYPVSLYSFIPTYRSVTDGNEFNLRDCIDFRLIRTEDINQWNCQTTIYPTSTINTEVDITYYLGRKDRIYVTNNRQNFDSPYDKFLYVQGTETTQPVEPEDETDINKLCLAILDIPPYAQSGFDIKITYEDNKRYTMRDIGKLEDSIIKLDRVTKLQSVEIASIKTIVLNENGDELLKTGILIEDFSDLDKMDLESGYAYVAVDEQEKECFPGIDAHYVGMNLIQDNDIVQLNDIITMKYKDETFVSQVEANSDILVNPGAIDDGRGRAVPSKKNSLSVNIFNSAGAFLASSIATRTIAAYLASYKASSAIAAGQTLIGKYAGQAAVEAAYNADSVIVVAWKACRTLLKPFSDAFPVIESILKFVETKAIDAYEIGLKTVEAFSNNQFSSIFSSTKAVEGGQAVQYMQYGNPSTWSVFSSSVQAGWSQITTAIGQMFEGQLTLGQGLSGVQAGIVTIATAINTAAFTALVNGANAVYAAVTGGKVLIGDLAFKAGLKYINALPGVVQVLVAVAVVYVAIKIVQKVWKSLKKLFSDERMKDNIELIGKDKNGLNIYSFEYKKEFKEKCGYGRYKGYLAQEVEKVYPKAVSMIEGYRTIDYSLIGR